MNKAKLMTWIKQPSTWKAVVILLSVFGVSVAPERIGEILTAAAVVYGGISALWDSH